MLALVPAGFLVLMLLGALAVDSGATYLGQRQLTNDLQAAANDAAGAALSNGALYGQGIVRIDPVQAAAVVCQELAAQGSHGLLDITVDMAVVGPAVFVEGHAKVRAVFGSLVPAFAERPVSAEAAAFASVDAAQLPPASPTAAAYQLLDCL